VISGDGGLARQVRHQARDAVLRLISAVRLWMCGVSGPVDSTSLQRTLTVSRILPVLQYGTGSTASHSQQQQLLPVQYSYSYRYRYSCS
jgi:hypothetical protein